MHNKRNETTTDAIDIIEFSRHKFTSLINTPTTWNALGMHITIAPYQNIEMVQLLKRSPRCIESGKEVYSEVCSYAQIHTKRRQIK